MRIEVVALPTDREVGAGDDLAALVLDACDRVGVRLQDGDVLCVAQKVVSKAEGAVVDAPPGDPHAARRAVARDQAVRVVADSDAVLIVETRHGLVCANAGVDASNLPEGRLALLPEDPDASAGRLRTALAGRTGTRVGVLVTDTFGRPWRMGQTDVAIGAAGVTVIRDERGGRDRLGRTLEVTEAAVADEIAGAADLARHKADGTPFVLVRGAAVVGEGSGADLVRPAEQDLFRVGGPRATLAGLADRELVEPAPPAVVAEIAALAAEYLPTGGGASLRPEGGALVLSAAGDDDLAAGGLLVAARVAATTAGWATRWEPAGDDEREQDGHRVRGRLLLGRERTDTLQPPSSTPPPVPGARPRG